MKAHVGRGVDEAKPEMFNGKAYWPDEATARRHVAFENECRVMRWKSSIDRYVTRYF